jgi:uncharacterized surface protein with fasciclin (FAS1) repeats
MRMSRRLAGLSLGVAITVGGSLAVAPAASAAPATAAAASATGSTSLASVLLKDKSGFDHNDKDYDVLTAAVLAVLKAKPHSKVSVLTKGNVALTAFLPDDRAFRLLVKDITGKNYSSEKDVFTKVASLGINTVEAVLLYHVVPGATITAAQAAKANGVKLTTAQGGKITVHVKKDGKARISLVDADTNDRDPKVISTDLNKGNKQIAHGIDRVLRPINLP